MGTGLLQSQRSVGDRPVKDMDKENDRFRKGEAGGRILWNCQQPDWMANREYEQMLMRWCRSRKKVGMQLAFHFLAPCNDSRPQSEARSDGNQTKDSSLSKPVDYKY